MATLHISTQQEFQTNVLQSPKPVLVDFFAEWCGPCKIMAPILEEISSETPSAVIAKVDVDASPEIAEMFNISSIPTFLLFSGGAVVAQSIGAVGKAQMKAMLAKAQ